jgi:aminoglycoside 6'-N-acetyltransferase I
MEQAFVVPVTKHWNIREAGAGDAPAWVAMRAVLWPEGSATEHAQDVCNYFDHPRRAVAFLAFDVNGKAIGFAEATVRTDYVNGTDTSPVGFLEGWYVDPSGRSQGVGRGLVAAVERWTRQQGCTELASDAWLASVPSQRSHVACGFEETERVVCFRKRLADAS